MAISSPRPAHARNQLANLPPYFFHAAVGIHIVKRAEPPVILHQGRCQFLVRVQPGRHNFFAIVCAVNQLAAIGIANPLDLRRALVNIINLAAQLAGPSSGQPLHQDRSRNNHVNHERLLETLPPQQLAQILRLGDRSRKPVEHETMRSIRSATILSTSKSGTSSPRSIIGLAFEPRGVPLLTCSRSMSPVERCGTPYCRASSFACVPFPEPGGPRKITARSSFPTGRSSSATLALP